MNGHFFKFFRNLQQILPEFSLNMDTPFLETLFVLAENRGSKPTPTNECMTPHLDEMCNAHVPLDVACGKGSAVWLMDRVS